MKKYFLITTQLTFIFHGTWEDAHGLIQKRGGSCSHGYDSIKELKEDQEILNEVCSCCGGFIKARFTEPVRTKLIEKKLCFSCNHWDEIYQDIDNPDRFIIDGDSYHNVKKDTCFKGFGGSLFKIKRYNTNEIIETRNLWHQGKVSIHLIDKIKNNACFLPTH